MVDVEVDDYNEKDDDNLKKWKDYYACAVEYRKKHGNLAVPSTYETEDGVKLGNWIRFQREKYKRNPTAELIKSRKYKQKIRKDKLTKWQTTKLEEIDMVWDSYESSWEEKFELAKEYYEAQKNLLVPSDYETENGVKLGVWIRTQRAAYKGKRRVELTEEQIAKLEEIGMIWDPHQVNWEEKYQLAKEYYKGQGDLLILKNYETENGVRLGKWISKQRVEYKKKKLTEERIKKLEEIGMVWEARNASEESSIGLLDEREESRTEPFRDEMRMKSPLGEFSLMQLNELANSSEDSSKVQELVLIEVMGRTGRREKAEEKFGKAARCYLNRSEAINKIIEEGNFKNILEEMQNSGYEKTDILRVCPIIIRADEQLKRAVEMRWKQRKTRKEQNRNNRRSIFYG